MHREAVGGIPDPRTVALLEEVLAEPGIPRALAHARLRPHPSPVLPVHFVKGELDVSYFSLVTTVGTPQDITLQEIRLECFFPALPP